MAAWEEKIKMKISGKMGKKKREKEKIASKTE